MKNIVVAGALFWASVLGYQVALKYLEREPVVRIQTELVPTSGCFITDDSFLICKLGD